MPACSSFLPFSRIALASILAIALHPVAVQSQSTPDLSNSDRQRLVFVPPAAIPQDVGDELGRPPNRNSGGSRGPCTEELVALVPGQGKIDTSSGVCTGESVSVLALTSEQSPTFWLYVPQPSTPELRAEFVLLEGKNLVYKQTIPLAETPGIVSIPLDYKLKPNQVYRWLFSVVVNPQRPSQNPSVEGLIQFRQSDIELGNQRQDLKLSRDLIAVSAKNGVWHDALTGLGQLRRQEPTDSNLKTDWSDLLDSVGLGAIAEVPIVDCCTSVTASKSTSN